ncbi:MAG: bifunctional oligoribonuclease/PAP phosphatase NrnA [Ruminococcaceae bacterium]|nr:bifunctional oligoribonuclease/PAP phosphatase NrnA [Oscillospiraceae bacterium]
MENNTNLFLISELLEKWDDILILTHANPDADTLGSAFAIKYAYPEKNIDVCCADNVPDRLKFITKGNPTALSDKEYSHIISVDSAELHLMGEAGRKYEGKIELKIDHHRTSTEFATYNYADETSGACGEIIYDILTIKNRINKNVAEALYAAIASDTGCFKYRNVQPKSHIVAAELIFLGIDFGAINTILFENKSKGEIAAMRFALNSLEYYYDGKVALIGFTNEIKEAKGIDDDALASVNSLPREIEGVELGIVIKEKSQKPGEFKVSMRSGVSVDCSEICQRLGGGGHIRASGASVKAESIENAKDIILKAVSECIEK